MMARPALLAVLAAAAPVQGWAADHATMAELQGGFSSQTRLVASGPTVPAWPGIGRNGPARPGTGVAAIAAAVLAGPATMLPATLLPAAGPDPVPGPVPGRAAPRPVPASPVVAVPAPAFAPVSAPASAPASAQASAPVEPRIVLSPPREGPAARVAQGKPVAGKPKPARSQHVPRPPAPPLAIIAAPRAAAEPALKPVETPAPVGASLLEQPLAIPAIPPVPIPEPAPALRDVIGAVLQEPLPAPVLPVREEPAIRIEAGPELGVAAYTHDDQVIFVFDQRVPIDPAQLRPDPDGAAAGQVQLGADSTVLTVPWPAGTALSVLRRERAWLIAATPDPVPARPMVAMPADRRMELRTEQPGRVVTIVDPLDGRTLLVGTARGTDMGRPFVATAFRAPEYTVLPSVLGVVIEPLSDAINLRPTPRGFAISATDDLTPAAAQVPPAPTASRRFTLPALPAAALARRLQAELTAAAAAPPRARAAPRLAAAQSYISLGFGLEAQAVLALTAIEDPAAATDPDRTALAAIAALLAGRPAEAQGLDLPALDGSDEIALWRAIRTAWRDGAAPYDAALLPVALGYPAALQARLLPTLADAAAAAGDDAALALIDAAMPGLPGVRLAQAVRLAQSGPADPALAILDTLRDSPDRYTATRAAVAAIELRLQQQQITPAEAIDQLDRQSLAWRGGTQELALRERMAALRVQAGLWRPALEGLRDLGRLTDTGDPGARAAMQDRVGTIFRAMLAPDAAPIPPLDFVALISEFADGVPVGQELASALADRLIALDLPLRARSVLTPLLQSTPPGPVRAGIGARVAQLSLDVGATKEAEAALATSDAPGLPAALLEQRVLLDARARAARYDRAGAVAQLTGLGTAAADDLRATLLTQAGDWPAALAALNALAIKRVPIDGPLPDTAQDIILRQATAAVNGNDTTALTALRGQLPRMDDRRGGMLRLLTAPPVTGSIDIARAGQELALGREIPGRAVR